MLKFKLINKKLTSSCLFKQLQKIKETLKYSIKYLCLLFAKYLRKKITKTTLFASKENREKNTKTRTQEIESRCN